MKVANLKEISDIKSLIEKHFVTSENICIVTSETVKQNNSDVGEYNIGFVTKDVPDFFNDKHDHIARRLKNAFSELLESDIRWLHVSLQYSEDDVVIDISFKMKSK